MAARGFTLLELLVVLAVLALVTALALPQFSRALPGLELRSSAQALASRLRLARETAVRSNREIEVDLAAGDAGVPATVLVSVAAADGSAGVEGIRFFPDGSSTGGLITLAQGDRRRLIAVDWLTGGVHVPE